MSTVRVIPLNLIFTYPVKWSRYKVLRDFVQNFFDAIEHKNWMAQFQWRRDGNSLVMEASEVSFSHEWLIHIGASTKRDSDHNFAGYFGEGFKIASLCAVRDHGWQVRMASKDWVLDVTTTKLAVDQTELESLAYRMQTRSPPCVGSELRISPFTPEHETLFQCVLLSFYYRENPLFGHCLCESDEFAVYLRSTMLKPSGFPETSESNGPGIVFAGFQALGSFRYPLVVCLHTYRFEDRERNNLYAWDVIQLVSQVARHLPPVAAAAMLEQMKNVWYRYPKKRYDIMSWYNVIEKLAYRVASSEACRTAWKEAHPNLVVARKVKKNNVAASNQRRQALDWFQSKKRGFRLVQDSFLVLGYPELETICEEAGGFARNYPPDTRTLAYIQILESTVKAAFAEFIPEKGLLPQCFVIQNNTAVWQGMAICHRLSQPIPTASGHLIRYHLSHIELKISLFNTDLFSTALSTYLHELAHAFGGHRTKAFSHVLTDMLEVALQKAAMLEKHSQNWDNLTSLKIEQSSE